MHNSTGYHYLLIPRLVVDPEDRCPRVTTPTRAQADSWKPPAKHDRAFDNFCLCSVIHEHTHHYRLPLYRLPLLCQAQLVYRKPFEESPALTPLFVPRLSLLHNLCVTLSPLRHCLPCRMVFLSRTSRRCPAPSLRGALHADGNVWACGSHSHVRGSRFFMRPGNVLSCRADI